MDVDDTIAAIASAPGGAARGVVRVSGSNVLECLGNCFQSPLEFPRRAATRLTGLIRVSALSSTVPVGLYFWPTTRSYTGQPTVEIHTLGSTPILEAILAEVCRSNARLANPGEFTLRAFLAGRLDLPQAEAVLGLIDATSERQFRAALTQLSGGLSQPLNRLRDRLLGLLADLEAGLDFVEEDIEFISPEHLRDSIRRIHQDIRELEIQLTSRSATNELPRVVITGQPNAGKSTLWNRLLDKERAIVSDQPGTTRDYLSEIVCLKGTRCMLVDTAGIDASQTDQIDQIAQEFSKSNDSTASLRLLCIDVTDPHLDPSKLDPNSDAQLIVFTKADANDTPIPEFDGAVVTSSYAGLGIDILKDRIAEKLNADLNNDSLSIASTATRCRESLRLVRESLARAAELAAETGEELIAAELRVALNELAAVVGAVYTDDILDRIFSKFCIGK